MAEDEDNSGLERIYPNAIAPEGTILPPAFQVHVPARFFNRPRVYISCLLSLVGIAAWFLSEFLSIRGYVNPVASRLFLVGLGTVLILAVCIAAANLPKFKVGFGIIVSVVVIVGLVALDRITLPKQKSENPSTHNNDPIEKASQLAAAHATPTPDAKANREPKPDLHPRKLSPPPIATAKVPTVSDPRQETVKEALDLARKIENIGNDYSSQIRVTQDDENTLEPVREYERSRYQTVYLPQALDLRQKMLEEIIDIPMSPGSSTLDNRQRYITPFNGIGFRAVASNLRELADKYGEYIKENPQ